MAANQPTNDEATPAKARVPHKRGLTPEQLIAARGYYANVTKDMGVISEWIGCNPAKLAQYARFDHWGERPWTQAEQSQIDSFGSEMKARAEAFNREAYEASLFYTRFHRKAARRVEADADEVQVAGGRDEDTLMARMRSAPPFAQVVTSGRLVTGQSTEKADDEVSEWYEKALSEVLGGKPDSVQGGSEPGGDPKPPGAG